MILANLLLKYLILYSLETYSTSVRKDPNLLLRLLLEVELSLQGHVLIVCVIVPHCRN